MMPGIQIESGDRTSASPGLIATLAGKCKTHLVLSATFAFLVDVLYLASPIYLINVYDRVLSSGNRYTLVMLSVALVLALATLVVLDDARARLLIRMGLRIDREVGEPLMLALIREASRAGGKSHAQAIRDLDNFRQVITGPGILIFFDAPWTPLFSLVLYWLHPLLGLVAVAGAVILLLLAAANEFAIRGVMRDAGTTARVNYAHTDEILHNAETVLGLGMETTLLARWKRSRDRLMTSQALASGRASGFNSVIKFVRFGLQALVVATAVWLILDRQVSPGVIFPAMILLGRALAPVEQAVSSWKSLVGARQSFSLLAKLLDQPPSRASSMRADRIEGAVSVERLTLTVKDRVRPILRSVGFSIKAGEALGIVGANGSGKSSLARVLVGLWQPTFGSVRIDGADVSQLNRSDVSRFIGYLPQDVQLLSGTVKENIGHFRDDISGEVLAAARLAHVHEQILRLPEGYDTEVGEGGAVLSAGMRQRLGLARALFADPAVIVLDEPNSNLDAEAEACLVMTLQELKSRGKTVVLIAHRPSLMSVVDRMLVLNDGAVDGFGTRAEILPGITRLAPVKVAHAGSEKTL